MIYALYHHITDTPMSENGMPGWVDLVGGIMDMTIIIAIPWVLNWVA